MAEYTIKNINVKCYALSTHNGITQHWWTLKTFTKETDHLGRSRYFVNGEEVTKEKGNDIYRNLRKDSEGAKTKHPKDWFVATEEVVEYTYDGYIRILSKNIDQYIDYIDNYRQYLDAQKHNEKLLDKIKYIKKLKEEKASAERRA